MDWIVIVCALILQIFGAVTVGSVTPNLLVSQLGFYALGWGVFYLFSRFDYRLYRHFRLYLYGLILLGLALTLLIGLESRGAMRWITIGDFRLQFSEIFKPLLAAALAPRAAILGIIPTLLVLRQPDLGSAIVYLVGIAAMTFAGGLSWIIILLGAAAAAAFLPLGWHFLADYQKLRLLSFFQPGMDPLGASYNAIQSQIAVGSGMLLGRGLGRGSQAQLFFLPERHTDFVFAALAEGLGFAGAVVLLAVYFVLLWRIFSLADQAPDTAGKVLTVGLGAMLLAQMFINVGMNLGVVPVTGITLPLVSYGGSSIIATMAALGIIQNIARQRHF